ncbi:MAG: hypothetical protein M1823_000422 [Watsoniomyces obsoletus]|nr:MAG: hypothetical protein M1823_000422 [Watsoniomyces obsoletus]
MSSWPDASTLVEANGAHFGLLGGTIAPPPHSAALPSPAGQTITHGTMDHTTHQQHSREDTMPMTGVEEAQGSPTWIPEHMLPPQTSRHDSPLPVAVDDANRPALSTRAASEVSGADIAVNGRKGGTRRRNAKMEQVTRMFHESVDRTLDNVAEQVHSLMQEGSPADLEKSRLLFGAVWMRDHTRLTPGRGITHEDAYIGYENACRVHGIPALHAASFGKCVGLPYPDGSGLSHRRIGGRGSSKYSYWGIDFVVPLHELLATVPTTADVAAAVPSSGTRRPSPERLSQGSISQPQLPPLTALPATPGLPRASTSSSSTWLVLDHASPSQQPCLDDSNIVHRRLLLGPGINEPPPVDELAGSGFVLPPLPPEMRNSLDAMLLERFSSGYETYVMQSIVCFRVVRRGKFAKNVTRLAQDLTRGGSSLMEVLRHPCAANWIEEVDHRMYQQMTRLLTPNVFNAASPISELLKSFQQKGVVSTLDPLNDVLPEAIKAVKIRQAKLFESIFAKFVRVHDSYQSVLSIFSVPEKRNRMFHDWKTVVDVVRVVSEEVPRWAGPTVINIMTHSMEDLLAPTTGTVCPTARRPVDPRPCHVLGGPERGVCGEELPCQGSSATEWQTPGTTTTTHADGHAPTSHGHPAHPPQEPSPAAPAVTDDGSSTSFVPRDILSRWALFLKDLPERLAPRDGPDGQVHESCVVKHIKLVGMAIIRDLSLAKCQSVDDWIQTKIWFDELTTFFAEVGGFLLVSSSSSSSFDFSSSSSSADHVQPGFSLGDPAATAPHPIVEKELSTMRSRLVVGGGLLHDHHPPHNRFQEPRANTQPRPHPSRGPARTDPDADIIRPRSTAAENVDPPPSAKPSSSEETFPFFAVNTPPRIAGAEVGAETTMTMTRKRRRIRVVEIDDVETFSNGGGSGAAPPPHPNGMYPTTPPPHRRQHDDHRRNAVGGGPQGDPLGEVISRLTTTTTHQPNSIDELLLRGHHLIPLPSKTGGSDGGAAAARGIGGGGGGDGEGETDAFEDSGLFLGGNSEGENSWEKRVLIPPDQG